MSIKKENPTELHQVTRGDDWRPMLTLFVRSYNQVGFIEETLQAALAQSYTPLEILVLDDCSSDGTFQHIERIAQSYHGQHTLRIIQNERNLRLAGQVNKATQLARGELVIMADGDDISLPWRVEAIWQAWRTTKFKALAIHSRSILIDEKGAYLGCDEHGNPLLESPPEKFQLDDNPFIEQRMDLAEYVSNLQPPVNGCSVCWSPQLFAYYGPLPIEVQYDDKAIAFRAFGLGSISYISVPLVKWRVHGGNASLRPSQARVSLEGIQADEHRDLKKLGWELAMYRAMHADLAVLQSSKAPCTKIPQDIAAVLDSKITVLAARQEFLRGGFISRLRNFPRLWHLLGGRQVLRSYLGRLFGEFLWLRLRLLQAQRKNET